MKNEKDSRKKKVYMYTLGENGYIFSEKIYEKSSKNIDSF